VIRVNKEEHQDDDVFTDWRWSHFPEAEPLSPGGMRPHAAAGQPLPLQLSNVGVVASN